MRATARGLLFRVMRMLFLITMIAAGLSACLAALEGMQAPVTPGAARRPAAPPR